MHMLILVYLSGITEERVTVKSSSKPKLWIYPNDEKRSSRTL